MKKVTTDVDIDVFGRDKILEGLECIFGRIDRPDGSVDKHPSGVYFQNIPRDPTTNVSTLDHRIANDYGYFKIDILPNNIVYSDVKDEEHLLRLMNVDPPWDFFEYPEITDRLFHLNGHSNLLKQYKPRCIEDLAMFLALYRPGKRHLIGESWEVIKKNIWIKGDEAYQFKRSHAIAYSLAIIVQLNTMIEKEMSKD
jgi:hypothetical protein